MSEQFDWDGLTAHIRAIRTHDDAHNALRERIESAFVPVERYKADLHIEIRGKDQATARAEAAEAECLEQARLLGMSSERELVLRAEIERLTRHAATARIEGVRAGIEASAEKAMFYREWVNWTGDTFPDEPGTSIRALDAEAIARTAALSDLIADDAHLIGTVADSDGDDGA